jgi:hypothetical protein
MSLGFRVGQSDFFYDLLVFRKAGASHTEREKERERERERQKQRIESQKTERERERRIFFAIVDIFSRERSFAIRPCALSRR